MKIDLTEKQFRRLLDLVYVGNWVMNSTRGDDRIREYDDVESTVFANCLSHGETGVEMEALTAVSVAALTVYDMCKAVQRDMRIDSIHLLYKEGGKSGVYEAEE